VNASLIWDVQHNIYSPTYVALHPRRLCVFCVLLVSLNDVKLSYRGNRIVNQHS